MGCLSVGTGSSQHKTCEVQPQLADILSDTTDVSLTFASQSSRFTNRFGEVRDVFTGFTTAVQFD